MKRGRKSAKLPTSHELDGQRFSDRDGSSVSWDIKAEEMPLNSELEQLPVFYGIKTETKPLNYELKRLPVKEIIDVHHPDCFHGGFETVNPEDSMAHSSGSGSSWC